MKNQLYPTLLTTLLIFGVMCLPTHAVDYTWTGAVDGDWANAANWDANGVPVDFESGRSGLSFEGSADRIVIDATDFSPTTNVPQLNPSNSNNAATPTVDVINGSVDFSVTSSLAGNGTIIRANTFTTIGDGDASTGLASLTYSFGSGDRFRRHDNFAMAITVNSDGSLIFNSGNNTTISNDGNKTLHVTLAGGSTSFSGTVTPLRNSSTPGGSIGNSWFDFTAEGASFTAIFGSVFADLDWVNFYIEEGEFFLASTGLELSATDNGDGTFTVAVVDTATTFPLTITKNPDTPGTFDFEWASQPGKLYDLVSSTDLDTPILTWPVYDPDGEGGEEPFGDIESGGLTTTLTDVPGDGPRRFFAVVEKDGPPVFFADFETDGAGFTPVGAPNDWAWGTPDSDNSEGLVITGGNDDSTGAWATVLGTGGSPSGTIDTDADSILRSPDIDLTGISGARLSFAAAYDAAAGDTIEVRVFDADTDDLLDTISPVDTGLNASSDWTTLGPFDLSAADDTNIYLEFRYQGNSNQFIGLYIDDVTVTRD